MNVRDYKIAVQQNRFNNKTEEEMVDAIIAVEKIKQRLPGNNPPIRRIKFGSAKKDFRIPKTNRLADRSNSANDENAITAKMQQSDIKNNIVADLNSIILDLE